MANVKYWMLRIKVQAQGYKSMFNNGISTGKTSKEAFNNAIDKVISPGFKDKSEKGVLISYSLIKAMRCDDFIYAPAKEV